MTDREAMQAALAQARLAAEGGEVPIGAVVVYQGLMIAQAQNCVIRHLDPRRTRRFSPCAPRLRRSAITGSPDARSTPRWSLAPCAPEP